MRNIRFLTRTTENNFATNVTVRVTVQVEREHRIHQTLLDHVVEHRHDAIDRDGWEAQTENTIEFGGDERDSRLLYGFGERLVLNVSASDRNCVSG